MVAKYLLCAGLFLTACLIQDSSAAITPVDKTYTATVCEDFIIPWAFDNEASLDQVVWRYKSSQSAATVTIMSQLGTGTPVPVNNFDVEPVENGQNGDIRIKNVTDPDKGIYYCQVSYTLPSLLPALTGTATLSVASCECECECHCTNLAIAQLVCCIVECAGFSVLIISLYSELFGKNGKNACKVSAVISIVFGIISIILGGLVLGRDCESCSENCSDCCSGSCEDCCPEWIGGLALAFIVIAPIVVVVVIILVYLVYTDRIHLSGNGDFPCFDRCCKKGDFPCFDRCCKKDEKGPDDRPGHEHGGRGVPLTHSRVHADHEEKSLSARGGSDSEVSRQDVDVRENRENILEGKRPMPPIPMDQSRQKHDSKGRGLSANYDDDHPMISIGVPEKKKGDLGPLQEEPKKKKKKKKKRQEDDDDYDEE